MTGCFNIKNWSTKAAAVFSIFPSEVHAAESVAYLNRAQVRLQDIWEEIGIPEEQRIQRTNEVHKHIKVSPKSIKKNNVDSLAGLVNSPITVALVL